MVRKMTGPKVRLVLLVVFAILALWNSGIHTCARAQSGGAAVVISVPGTENVGIPDVRDLVADPGRASQTYRVKGFGVAADPSGRCLAVTPIPHFAIAQLHDANVPNYVLASAIAERVSVEQLDARVKGYLHLDSLSAEQREAASLIARRKGFVNEEGQPSKDPDDRTDQRQDADDHYTERLLHGIPPW